VQAFPTADPLERLHDSAAFIQKHDSIQVSKIAFSTFVDYLILLSAAGISNG
jgi:hypothetical protein